MCLGNLSHEDHAQYVKYKQNIQRWLRAGKSHDFLVRQLHMGCPTGKRRSHCGCGINNGGKSRGKGKGRNKSRPQY